MTVQTTTRNASLDDFARLLQTQHARKIDVVAPATALRSNNGLVQVQGTEVQLSEDGVTATTGNYRPTSVFDGQLAEKLDIPIKYLRKLRETRPDLLDANINGLLHGKSVRTVNGQLAVVQTAEADARSFLFRGFKSDESSEPGVARALLSDRYGIVDNLDVLLATLDGIKQAGVNVEIPRCDLTDSRMYVQVTAPEVSQYAGQLLDGYRSPFTGNSGSDNPTVFAGFVVSNSETGGGAFSITPRLVVSVCTNGMTLSKDVVRSVHLGSRLDEGIVRWSEDTQRKNLAVVTAKARDAVATFLDVEYVQRALSKISEKAGAPVTNAAETIKNVGKVLAYSEAEQAGILDHFIKGGQLTAGGVLQAVTSFAQTIEDADAAYDFEATGMAAMELAAK